MKAESFTGKTYTLALDSPAAEGYYITMARLADRLSQEMGGAGKLLEKIRKESKRGGSHRSLQAGNRKKGLKAALHEALHAYTPDVKGHLKEISPWTKCRDKRLATTERQYHLYMLETELVNRMNKDTFLSVSHRIALLPHCLKDLEADCRATKQGFDMVCKACSGKCYIHRISSILRKNRIEPYIWMRTDFRKLNTRLTKEGKKLGILGIACIPELTAGLRRCEMYGIPAVGVPLNANRCARWMDDFYPNSVSLDYLSRLLIQCNGESNGSAASTDSTGSLHSLPEQT